MSQSVSHSDECYELAEVDESRTNVANHSYGLDEAKNHTYTVTIEDGNASSCTCPHFTYRVSYCKHMAAVDQAIIESEDEKEISGPHVGRDKYGNIDHTYWKCESCGAEATRKEALEDCC